MENSRNRKIARFIAFIDEILSVVDLLYTFVNFFGGEAANGLFYQVDHHAHLGDIKPEQVTGKKALAGLMLFISLLINVLWIFAAFMLFKGTELKDCVPSSYQRELRCCKIWFYTSILLLFVHGVNLILYMTDSVLEPALASLALLARSVFMYFVQKYMRELHEGPSSHQPVYLLYALPNGTTSSCPEDREETPFMPTTVTQQHARNGNSASHRPRAKSSTSVMSNGTHHRVILTPDAEDGVETKPVPRSMSEISEGLYELNVEDYCEGPSILAHSSTKGMSISRSHPMTA